jgi:hypothetical protein
MWIHEGRTEVVGVIAAYYDCNKKKCVEYKHKGSGGVQIIKMFKQI